MMGSGVRVPPSASEFELLGVGLGAFLALEDLDGVAHLLGDLLEGKPLFGEPEAATGLLLAHLNVADIVAAYSAVADG
jgi:hypothetical protein